MTTKRTPNTAEAIRATVDPEALRLASRLQGVDPHAIEQLADYGPAYFNPLIHRDEEKTFEAIESVMQMLHILIDSDEDIAEIRPGLALVVQTVWAAAQYERDRRASARYRLEQQGDCHD